MRRLMLSPRALLTGLLVTVLALAPFTVEIAAAKRPLPWRTFSGMAQDAVNVNQAACAPEKPVLIVLLQTPAKERFVMFVAADGTGRWVLAQLGEKAPEYVWEGQQEEDTASEPDRHDRVIPRKEHPFDEARDNEACRVLYPENA